MTDGRQDSGLQRLRNRPAIYWPAPPKLNTNNAFLTTQNDLCTWRAWSMAEMVTSTSWRTASSNSVVK